MAPVNDTALIGPLKSVQGAGIPVITFDTDVKDSSARIANITSDNVSAGKQAPERLAKTAGSGKVAVATDMPGGPTTTDRLKGFESALAQAAAYLGPQRGNDDPTQAPSVASALLQREPELSGIFAADRPNGKGTEPPFAKRRSRSR